MSHGGTRQRREERRAALQLAEAVKRQNRRVSAPERRRSDMRGELEPMITSGRMGRLTPFETLTNERIAKLEDRLHAREERPR